MFAIGVGNDWSFSKYAASKGCSVHAFDPTLQLRSQHSRIARTLNRVRFHFAGLGGAPAGQTKNSYGTIDMAQLMTLDEMIAATPSTDGKLVALSIDCEGCEWAGMEQVANNTSGDALRHVQLVTMELHVSPTMVAPTLRQFVGLFDLMLDKLGFRLWWQRTNDGYPYDQRVIDFLGVGGLRAGLCCYELAFVRPPHGAQRNGLSGLLRRGSIANVLPVPNRKERSPKG